MKFVLFDEQANVYAGLNGLKTTLEESADNAVIFDHRDSKETKCRFYNAITGYNFAAVEVQ